MSRSLVAECTQAPCCCLVLPPSVVGISEMIVVTASKVEEELVDAPASVGVINDRTIRDAGERRLRTCSRCL